MTTPSVTTAISRFLPWIGKRVGVAAVALAIPATVLAAPAQAAATGTVAVKTQRMSDATLNSKQVGWYGPGTKLTLVCHKRGQPVLGHFSRWLPNGGWDNIWYQTSDGSFVADVDIETGTQNPLGSVCGAAKPAAAQTPAAKPAAKPQAPAPAATSSGVVRKMGNTRATNSAGFGWCTWGAYDQWYKATGKRYYPVIGGNARDWPANARANGWTVTSTPAARAIVAFQPRVHGADPTYGHVAWVQSVSPRPGGGTNVSIVEMNGANGFGKWAWRTVPHVSGMSYILLP